MGRSKTPGLSLAHVRKDLRKRGITILSRNGEYCVKYKGASTKSVRTFSSQDLSAAWAAGCAMAQRRDRWRRTLGLRSSPPISSRPAPSAGETGDGQHDRARAAVRAAVDAYGIAKTLVGLCGVLVHMNTPYTVRLAGSLERFLDVAQAADKDASWAAEQGEEE